MSTSEMLARVRAFDWSQTPLGPLDAWPQSLRIAVGICLSSRFPMFVWWGPELINIYNDAYVPVLGAKHPDALGKPARPTWHEIWDVVGPQAEAVMERGEASWNERVLLMMERHGYAEETYFTWSYSPVWDEQGKVGGMFCACTEETGRVLAERDRDRLLVQVESERARLAEAFAQSPSFLAILRGPEHVFEYVNERFLRLVGGRRNILGKPLRKAVPEVEGQGFFEILDRVYATGEPFVGSGMPIMLQRQPDKPLETAYLDFVYQPLRGPDGAVAGILAHGVDITERHEAERALRESEARFRQLADAMPQIVFVAEPDGHIVYFNRQWYQYTGRPEGETAFQAWREVHTEEGLARVQQAWPEALRTGQPYELEFPLRRHDGKARWHLARALPIRDDAGRIVHWFGTATDIHDRKQIEDALAKALRMEQQARGDAEAASRMKDEFLATVSHELRTPLNAILGWSHLMRREGATPQDMARGVEVIERNARAQAAIIEDLLDMSRIVSGKVRLQMEPLDIGEAVLAAVETARPTADAKHIQLSTQVDMAAGGVLGDPNRMQQILWNLLSNAIKFTPRSGRIDVSLARDDNQIRIVVADSGQGILPEFLPFVFDRFRQADSSATRQHGGLGLGLSIVKHLVELHGGTVSVASEGRDRGATFTVVLPVTEIAERAQEDAPETRARAPLPLAVAREESAVIAGKRILVVDDEPDVRELVKHLLEQCRASVTTAASGAEALRLVQAERFDVLVSDIGMPDQDGHELMRYVRSLGPEQNGEIPAMALTAYARPEDRLKAIRAGFQMHAAKPVEPAELIAMVASLAKDRHSREGSSPA